MIKDFDQNEKQRCYYRGVIYESEADFWLAVRDFNYSNVTKVSMREMLLAGVEDLLLNAEMYQIKMTNNQFREIASDHINRLIYSMLKDKEKNNE